jgi:hypothetical protein
MFSINHAQSHCELILTNSLPAMRNPAGTGLTKQVLFEKDICMPPGYKYFYIIQDF